MKTNSLNGGASAKSHRPMTQATSTRGARTEVLSKASYSSQKNADGRSNSMVIREVRSGDRNAITSWHIRQLIVLTGSQAKGDRQKDSQSAPVGDTSVAKHVSYTEGWRRNAEH
eukprot:3864342-Rhodomonas_salina.1